MKIGVITYHFHPVINPRAFRALELVKEMCRSGHQVQLFIPDNDFSYDELIDEFKGLQVIKVRPGFFLNKQSLVFKQEENETIPKPVASSENTKTSFSKRFKRKLIEWFYPGGFNFEYGFTCGKYIRKNKFNFDVLVSVGLPINSHVAVWYAQRFRKRIANTQIADYGDPYYYNANINAPFFHKWFESRILNKFDHIVVPTEKMVASFEHYKSKDKIHVIPQGLDFSQFKLAELRDSDNSGKIHMAFAGNFYKEIRDPKELFKYLCQVEKDFVFTLYTNINSKENLDLIAPFRDKLGDKLELFDLLPRTKCIHELSKADFLINVSNTSKEQTPSKLIDYVLAGRPIFSYRPGEFNNEILNEFLQGNYGNDVSSLVKKEDFDIRNTVKKFLSLAN